MIFMYIFYSYILSLCIVSWESNPRPWPSFSCIMFRVELQERARSRINKKTAGSFNWRMGLLNVMFSPSYTVSACVLMCKHTVCLTHTKTNRRTFVYATDIGFTEVLTSSGPAPQHQSWHANLVALVVCSLSFSLCFSPSLEEVGKFVLQC